MEFSGHAVLSTGGGMMDNCLAGQSEEVKGRGGGADDVCL